MDFAPDAGYWAIRHWPHESRAVTCALYRTSGWVGTAATAMCSFGFDLAEQFGEVTL
ncbi:hypothetical protein [Marivita sp.]|uniref:hypothetical protein n=1 Tax=Marivita sp. TaxID=2003365 RepID=UPI0025B9664C|nr:hypothetical protein [Marivita sp.]